MAIDLRPTRRAMIWFLVFLVAAIAAALEVAPAVLGWKDPSDVEPGSTFSSVLLTLSFLVVVWNVAPVAIEEGSLWLQRRDTEAIRPIVRFRADDDDRITCRVDSAGGCQPHVLVGQSMQDSELQVDAFGVDTDADGELEWQCGDPVMAQSASVNTFTHSHDGSTHTHTVDSGGVVPPEPASVPEFEHSHDGSTHTHVVPQDPFDAGADGPADSFTHSHTSATSTTDSIPAPRVEEPQEGLGDSIPFATQDRFTHTHDGSTHEHPTTTMPTSSQPLEETAPIGPSASSSSLTVEDEVAAPPDGGRTESSTTISTGNSGETSEASTSTSRGSNDQDPVQADEPNQLVQGNYVVECQAASSAGPTSDSFLLSDGETSVERIDTNGDGRADLVKVGDEESRPIEASRPFWQEIAIGTGVAAAVVAAVVALLTHSWGGSAKE